MKRVSNLMLMVCLMFSCSSTGGKLVESSIPDNLFFSTEDYSKDRSAPLKLTDEFKLNENEFLSISFNLEKPLIESLQILGPNLSVAQLLEQGNFQFSFLVDEQLVYVENLNKGAGLPNSKIKDLNHSVPLVSPERIDFWGWYMWLRFMKLNGGQDALDEGSHILRIEIRPYLESEKLMVGDILANGSIKVEVSEILVEDSLITLQTIKPNSGWQLSSDAFNKNMIEALNKKIAQNRFENINGIVVVKEGKLLIEEYFNGDSRETLHDPRSVGKSFASTMMGIAIEEKHIKSEDLKLKDFYDLRSFKNYIPNKEEVTLKSLLTMSSGFVGDDGDYDNPGNEENMYPTDDWVRFTLDLPMDKRKSIGEQYTYFTAGVVVLGDVIHKSVPGGLVDYTDKRLFAPLDITECQWVFTPQKVGSTAGGLRLRALDFAKYGQLYKNKGLWKGEQIVSSDWVEKSLAKQIKQPNNDLYYGYLFWNKTFNIDNKNYEVSYCTGNGGNKIFIFKDIPYVIVITASAYNSPTAHPNVEKMMTEYILPSILNVDK